MCKTTLLAKYGFAASFMRVEAGISGDHMLTARQRQLPARTPAGPRAQHAPSPLLLTLLAGMGCHQLGQRSGPGQGLRLGPEGPRHPLQGTQGQRGCRLCPQAVSLLLQARHRRVRTVTDQRTVNSHNQLVPWHSAPPAQPSTGARTGWQP